MGSTQTLSSGGHNTAGKSPMVRGESHQYEKASPKALDRAHEYTRTQLPLVQSLVLDSLAGPPPVHQHSTDIPNSIWTQIQYGHPNR